MKKIIIPDDIPGIPLLAGCKEIGRGENTIVLEAPTVNGLERVYKVLSDPTDYAYYTADDRPTGKHFPVVYKDHGEAGKSSRGFPFHIVEVERLYPLANGDAAALARKITTSYFEACAHWHNLSRAMGVVALHHLVVGPFGWPGILQGSLAELEKFTNSYNVLPDLIKEDNLMMRKDGTLVFSDPVFMD